MNKIQITIVAALFAFIVMLPFISRAQVPFGGMVTLEQPCNNGLLLTVLTPLTGVSFYFWLYGELPFLMYVPPHPGQYLLGEAATAPTPCVLGIEYLGQGFPIIYHGESL